MKQLYFLVLALVLSQFSADAQVLSVSELGKSYFVDGTKWLQKGNYGKADSILTLALCSYKNVNVYFNRGVSRLYQEDTSGFCEDMGMAANKYFDEDACKNFNEFCCKSVDTVYYSTKYKVVDRKKYAYFEVIQCLKYDSAVVGSFHNKSKKQNILSVDFGCDQNIAGMSLNPTDIYALYELRDSTRYFYLTPHPINIINEVKYSNVKDQAQLLLRKKYGDLKTKNEVKSITVYYEITYSDNGDILSVDYAGTFPKMELGDKEDDLKRDLLTIVREYPKVFPAKFEGEKVNFIAYDAVTF